MAVRSKNTLKEFFQTGFRPTESNFADLIDSFVHKNALAEDGSSLTDQTLVLGRGIRLGADPVSPPNSPGTIRWNSSTSSFEVNTDGTTNWTPLGEGLWGQAGSDLTYSSGNVRAGGSTGNQAVMGTVTSGTFNNWAIMGHETAVTAGAFAMGQSPNGTIAFVAGGGRSVELRHQGGQYALFSGGGHILTGNVTVNGNLIENGNVTVNGTVTVEGNLTVNGIFTDNSDKRVKKEIQPLSSGLETINKLNPIEYKYNGKGGTPNGVLQYGLLAQDLQEVLPDLIHKRTTKLNPTDKREVELLTIDSKSLLYVLMQGIKELSQKVKDLEKSIQPSSE